MAQAAINAGLSELGNTMNGAGISFTKLQIEVPSPPF